jgi:hypothetical protein
LNKAFLGPRGCVTASTGHKNSLILASNDLKLTFEFRSAV